MNKLMTVIWQTYVSKVKSKAFIISTIAILLFLGVMSNGQAIVEMFGGGNDNEKVVIDDRTNGAYTQVLKSGLSNFDISVVSKDKVDGDVKKAIANDEYSGLLLIKMGEKGLPKATFKTNEPNTEVTKKLQSILEQVKVKKAAKTLDLSTGDVSLLLKPVAFDVVSIESQEEALKEAQTKVLVNAVLFVIYFSVIFYGSMITVDIATEKSSRVMEIIVSSVSPVKHMIGKLVGLAMLSLTQFLILGCVGLYFVSRSNGDSIEGVTSLMAGVPVSLIIYAIVFFLMGYFLYSALLAMLGSLVNRVEDANQVVTPVTFLGIITFLIASFGMTNPESPIITVTSFIPIFTPMVMFLRVGLLELPFWQVAVSIILTLGTIIGLIIVGARVYKGGVLVYDSSSVFKSFKQALKMTKE